MAISSLSSAKTFAAYLVDGQTVGVCSDFPVREPLPKGLQLACEGPVGLAISLHKGVQPFVDTLVLRPRILHLGIGCRKGYDHGRHRETGPGTTAAAQPDLKSGDGHRFYRCEERRAGTCWHLPREYALAVPLLYGGAAAAGRAGTFTPSAFVAKTVGVDNVCERAAVLDSRGGRLLLKKTSQEGVTLALACENLTVDFNQ
jgi:cobalt-precorrin 5A hydrolase